MNSDWIAAIDNAGETLCLHSSASLQLIQKRSRNLSPMSGMSESSTDSHSNEKPDMQLISELHVFTGHKLAKHTKLQIGHLCPDEILDLELGNFGDVTNMEDSITDLQSFENIPNVNRDSPQNNHHASQGELQAVSRNLS